MRPVKTAVALKNIQPPTNPDDPSDTGNTGKQTLYRLTPPLKGHKFVVVSTAYVPQGFNGPKYPETMVFPASPAGGITDYEQLYETGKASHEAALAALGYEVIDLR